MCVLHTNTVLSDESSSQSRKSQQDQVNANCYKENHGGTGNHHQHKHANRFNKADEDI